MDNIIMKQGLLRLSVCLLWTSGLIDGSDVDQTPILWKNKGDSATINCSHTKGVDYSQMYWYRQLPGETMKLVVFTTTTKRDFSKGFSKEKFLATKTDAHSGTFTVKNLEPEDKGLYFCAVTGGQYEAYFGQGTKLTVLDHPVTSPTNESVKVFGPSPFECRKPKDDERKKTLLCVVSGFYPDHVSVFWQVNGKNKTKGVATDNAAKWMNSSTELYRITSRLRVPADDWNNPKNEFTCIISFFNGNNLTHYQNSIRGVEAQTKGVMTRDNYLRITQSAKLSYGVFIIKSTIYGAFVALVVWKLQGSTGKQKH